MNNENQNNTEEIDLVLIIKKLWSKRKIIVKWGIVGLFIGVIVSFSIPKVYSTKIKLVSETKTSSQSSSVGALAGIMGMNIPQNSSNAISENIYPDIFKSTPFLMELVDIEIPYEDDTITLSEYLLKKQKSSWWNHVLSSPIKLIEWVKNFGEPDTLTIYNSPMIQKMFVDILTTKIDIQNNKKTNVIEISAQMQSAKASYIVSDSLYSKLQRYMTVYITQKARNNLKNSTKMKIDAQNKYYVADSMYSYILDRNTNLSSKVAISKVAKFRDERDLAFSVYQQLATQVEMDAVKLYEETPIATIIEPAIEPLLPIAPNKKIITLAFIILSMFICASIICVKEIISKGKDEETV